MPPTRRFAMAKRCGPTFRQVLGGGSLCRFSVDNKSERSSFNSPGRLCEPEFHSCSGYNPASIPNFRSVKQQHLHSDIPRALALADFDNHYHECDGQRPGQMAGCSTKDSQRERVNGCLAQNGSHGGGRQATSNQLKMVRLITTRDRRPPVNIPKTATFHGHIPRHQCSVTEKQRQIARRQASKCLATMKLI